MPKAILRAAALSFLCALLVFAPEIYAAVSAPYVAPAPRRVLLRVALCTQQNASADAFYGALSIYMKEHPTHHIRVTRHDEDQLFTLPDPQPDLFVFPEGMRYDPAQFRIEDDAALPVLRTGEASEGLLLCAISRRCASPDDALALRAHLTAPE